MKIFRITCIKCNKREAVIQDRLGRVFCSICAERDRRAQEKKTRAYRNGTHMWGNEGNI